jgi:hypothetical protein
MQTLNDLGQAFLVTSTSKGFTSGNLSRQDTLEKVLLVIGELSEGVEELRAGHHPCDTYFNPDKPDKPEGFPIEMADAIIRLLQLTAALGIDMDAAVALKEKYNNSRPYKHGKKF